MHVLGLFDAYGYQNHWESYGLGELADKCLPKARAERAPENGIMRSPYDIEQKITGTEVEMIFYAWSIGRLQVYEDSVLGITSQAFFN